MLRKISICGCISIFLIENKIILKKYIKLPNRNTMYLHFKDLFLNNTKNDLCYENN